MYKHRHMHSYCTHIHIRRVLMQSSHSVRINLEELPLRQNAGLSACDLRKCMVSIWWNARESVFNLPHLH